MVKFLKSHREWITILTSAIISTFCYFLFDDYKIPVYILGIVIIVALLTVWRMWISIVNLKQQVINPLKVKNINHHKNSIYVDVVDKYNILNANSYITLLIEDDNFYQYVGTGYITEQKSTSNLRRALLVHKSDKYKLNYLEQTQNNDKLSISVTIQKEYVDYLKEENNNYDL